jgi:hypothetical protein
MGVVKEILIRVKYPKDRNLIYVTGNSQLFIIQYTVQYVVALDVQY